RHRPAGAAPRRADPGATGVASSQPLDALEPAASSGLRRLLSPRASGPRPAAAGARPPRDGPDAPPAGRLPGTPGGPLPGVHHAGALLGQPGAAGSQPRPR